MRWRASRCEALSVAARPAPPGKVDVVYDNHEDGTRLRRWLTATQFSLDTSAPAVIDVSDNLQWRAIAPGTATVTVKFNQTQKKIDLTVVDSFPPLSRDEWLALFFTPEEIGDASVTGDLVDLDGDGLNTFMERITGGNPLFADPEHLLSVTTKATAREITPALTSHVSTQLLPNESVTLQRSTNLIDWESYFVFDGTVPEDDTGDLTIIEYGPFLEIQFKLEPVEIGSSEFFRFSVNPSRGIAAFP